MNPEPLILGLIDTARLALEIVARQQRGQLTDEELRAETKAMLTRLEQTNRRWEEAENGGR